MMFWLVAGMAGVVTLRKLLQHRPRTTVLVIASLALVGDDLYAAVEPHPVVQAIEASVPGPETLDALQGIAQQPVRVSVDQCSDEELARCYRQRNAQFADQMAQFLDVLNGVS